jgi:hypothetical protein
VINVFKIGQPIVLGMYKKSSMLNKINADDFILKLANVVDPLNEWELDIKVINDDPYWWTEPFYLFKAGDYIFHWFNENANINLKVRIRVENDYYDINDSDIII